VPDERRPPAPAEYTRAIEAFEFDKAIDALWKIVTEVNRDIDRERPWELSGDAGAAKATSLLRGWLDQVWTVTSWLQPFLPHTCLQITEKLYSGPVRRTATLFPRVR
jgi:methionyl-tRNA synthetase